jgi:hypothetical protein
MKLTSVFLYFLPTRKNIKMEDGFQDQEWCEVNSSQALSPRKNSEEDLEEEKKTKKTDKSVSFSLETPGDVKKKEMIEKLTLDIFPRIRRPSLSVISETKKNFKPEDYKKEDVEKLVKLFFNQSVTKNQCSPLQLAAFVLTSNNKPWNKETEKSCFSLFTAMHTSINNPSSEVTLEWFQDTANVIRNLLESSAEKKKKSKKDEFKKIFSCCFAKPKKNKK